MKKVIPLMILSFQLCHAMETQTERIKRKAAFAGELLILIKTLTAQVNAQLEAGAQPLEDFEKLWEQNESHIDGIKVTLRQPIGANDSLIGKMLIKAGNSTLIIMIALILANLINNYSKNGTNMSLADKARIACYSRILQAHGYTVILEENPLKNS